MGARYNSSSSPTVLVDCHGCQSVFFGSCPHLTLAPHQLQLKESTGDGGGEGAGARYYFSSTPTVDCHGCRSVFFGSCPHLALAPARSQLKKITGAEGVEEQADSTVLPHLQ